MFSANQEQLELFGVKKRLNDVERILAQIDAQMDLGRNFSGTSGYCHFTCYNWGHLLIYSYPEESLMTIDIFSTKSYTFVQAIKNTLLEVFAPKQYLCSNYSRIAGGTNVA